MENKNEDNDTEIEKENPYLVKMKAELKKSALNLKSDNTKQKKDKMEVLVNLLQMINISSTIKILKDDKTPIDIIPHLYLGSIGSASNLVELQKYNITHIICCAAGIQNFFPDKFKYYNLKLLDTEKEDIKKYFNEAYTFIDDAIKNNGNVLVHCHAGVSRSVTIIISYIMKAKKMSLDKTLELIRAKREKANPNPGFLSQLKKYQEELGIK